MRLTQTSPNLSKDSNESNNPRRIKRRVAMVIVILLGTVMVGGYVATASSSVRTSRWQQLVNRAARTILPPSLVPFAATYTWNQTGTASWATATNWTPTRTTPATDDILQFNNGATTTVTNVPTQTIGQLSVSGNTTVNLQGNAAGTTLTIGGGAGADLSVASGSQLNINVATNTTTINLATGTTGSIDGAMTLSAAAHKLTAADASAITFNNGAAFTAGTSFSGNAFGTTSLNSVIFASGSTYAQVAGSNPFGATAPNSVLTFQTGSLFKVTGASQSPSFSNRTYANVEFAGSGTSSMTGASAVSMDNLTVTSGTVNIGMTATPGHSIKGNISVASGATLNFNPASAGTINLNGTSAQTITVSGTFSANSSTTFNVNNAAGITLGSSLTFGGVLTLTSGVVNTSSTNLLTLSLTSAGAISGGSASSYIKGPLTRFLPAALATGSTYSFPIGKAGYNPFELVNPTVSSGGPIAVQAEEFDAASGGTAGTGLIALNTNRYWQAAITAGASFTNSSVQLTDSTITATNAIGQSATKTGTYNSIGGTVAGSTLTSNTISSLGFFTIGSLPVPTITVTGGPLSFGNQVVGTTSAEQTYTVAGSNLTADITVTAPSTDFQVSKTSGSGFGSSVTFTQSGGTVATQTVYVRFTPQSAGAKSGNVTNASSGATTQNVAVSGTGFTCPTSFTVDDTLDTPDANPGDGVCDDGSTDHLCTLRAAIMEANALAATACSPLTIDFSVTGTITLANGQLLVTHPNLTINGPGASQLTVSGNNASRIFEINSAAMVSISGLTITNGNGVGATNSGDGGGIFSKGKLTLTSCVVTGNTTTGATIHEGGGINNAGTQLLTLTNCTISNNTANFGGAGVISLGNLVMTGCTVANNTNTYTSDSGRGGGIETYATTTITNSTISNNHIDSGTGDNAGGVWNCCGPLTIINSTITGNSAAGNSGAPSAGGLLQDSCCGGSVTVLNSIIAGNTGASGAVADVSGAFVSNGYNLIGDGTGSTGFTGTGDQIGTTATPINALLSVLGNYGGTTQTHALLPGSPAINAGTSSGAPTNDQRGKSRVGAVDIGAFESQGFTLAATGGGGQSTLVNTNFTNPLTLTITANNTADGEPVNGGQVTFTAPGSGASCSFATNPATIASGAASSGTVTANSMAGSYNVTANATGAASSVSYALTNTPANTAPSFVTVATPSRQQGSPTSNSIIATVTDAETAAGSLMVTVTTTNPSNGVTISNIQNIGGTITADIVASCTAMAASFTLQVSDGSLTNTATLNVTVTTNTAPTVGTYAATAVALNGSLTVTPNAAPTDNGTIASVTATASPNTFTGTFSGDTSTGAVTISNAAPSGAYTITVTVTDNCGATVMKTFALMVDMCTPAPSNLGLWYRAEGNANAFVGGVNASTATNSGQASPTSPTYTTGKVGQAWNFNGTTDALDSAATTILNTFPVTIEAWVNPALRNDAGTTNLSSMVYPNNVISNDKAGFYGHGFGVNVTPDGSQFTIEYNDGFRVVPQANASFTAGQWYHIVVVYGLTGNQGSFKAYVNGQLVDQQTYTQGIVDGLSLIRIGYHNDDNGYGTRRFFKGLLDEVSIYQGCALQLADIQALFQAGAAGKCLSPLNLNAPPTITAAGTLSRSRGSSSVSTIATVNDTETPAGNLTVAVQSAPTGITVSNIQNNNGMITATVAADCTATLGDNTVVLYVSDGACATPFANLIVNVTANTSPTLMYNSASVTVAGSTMIAPAAGPSDNGSIASIALQDAGIFTGMISVNNVTGAISVSNAAPVGMHTITIRATDNCGAFTDATFTLSVTCPTITLGSLTGGTVGTGYSQSVSASPAGTYSYGVTSGVLPNGLTLNTSDGTISGTPTTSGTFNFRITAFLTGTGCSNFRDYSVVIACPSITLGSLSGVGTVGANYNQSAAASPAGTYSYAVTIGALPNGLTLNLSNGTVSGIPTATGTFNFRITATLTGSSCTGFSDYSIVVTCPTITLNPTTLPGGSIGAGYSQSVTASPAGTYSYGVTSGALPNGLTLNPSNGIVNGIPTVAGVFNFRITATMNGCVGFSDYSIVICPLMSSCPTNITTNAANGQCSAVVTYTPPTANAGCTGTTVACVPNSGSNFTVGTTTVTCTATDKFNNTASCSFTVQVNDTQPPMLGACPANITNFPAANGSCAATVTFTPPTVNDNCAGAIVTCTPASGSSFALGTTTVTCSAKDAANNMSAACTFTVQVVDTTPPTLSACPANITSQSAGAACTAIVTYTNPTASDNCGTTTVTCTPASGSAFALGTTTVSCVAKDAANNMSAACTFTVQVVDTTSPTLGACPTNITNVAAANGQCSAAVNFTKPTANDNCGTPTVTCTPASGSSFVVGTTTVSCVAKDAANNMSAACTFTVQVVDTQNPTISCPSNQNVGTSGSSAVVTYPAPTATDNCSGATTNCVPPSGAAFALGTTTVTCTATDASQRTASCSFTVTVTNTCSGIVCPSNVFVGTTGNSAVVNYPAPSANGTCGTITCSPASGSAFNVGVTTVTCNSSIGNQSCSFNVTVNRVSGTASDPLVCTGPGNTVQATLVITNNGNVNQTVANTTTFTNLVGVPSTCTVTPNVGTCAVTNGSLTYNASLTPGQTVTITYLTQASDLVQTGQQVCTNNSVMFNGGTPYVFSACGTANCPAVGPGNPFPAAAENSDQKAGSVLIYNVYTSGATSGNTQNTRINLTNTHAKLPAFVHLFFVAEGCSIADSYVCLTANQTTSFLASDLDPGTSGYLVTVAVDGIRGCPVDFNYLIGDEYVKFSSGHAANLGAIAFSALSGGLPACDGNSVTATLNFDGVSYNRFPAVLALSNVGSRADGNDTMLILNRIGGNLGIGATTLGTLFGVFYDDSENALSFSVAGNCQLRNSISNNFPRTTPRFESFIPAGRTGWLKVFSQTGTVGLTGSVINFNANAGASAGAFNQGHNLHVMTLTTASYVIPVFPPSC